MYLLAAVGLAPGMWTPHGCVLRDRWIVRTARLQCSIVPGRMWFDKLCGRQEPTDDERVQAFGVIQAL